MCANLNNKQYREIRKQHFPYMWLRCQSNTFPFSEQSNSDISLINSDFINFLFSKDTNIFPDEYLNSFFTECNSKEIPFNDSVHPVSISISTVQTKIPLLQLSILILRRYQNILMIYKIFYPYWDILLILLAFRNIKLRKIQWVFINFMFRNANNVKRMSQ